MGAGEGKYSGMYDYACLVHNSNWIYYLKGSLLGESEIFIEMTQC